MASDEASKESEFLSAFINASLESLDHKTIKDEQIECFHRIVWLGRYVLAVLPTGFSKSAIYQLIPKVLFHMGSTANATSKTNIVFLLAYKEEQKKTGRLITGYNTRKKFNFIVKCNFFCQNALQVAVLFLKCEYRCRFYFSLCCRLSYFCLSGISFIVISAPSCCRFRAMLPVGIYPNRASIISI